MSVRQRREMDGMEMDVEMDDVDTGRGVSDDERRGIYTVRPVLVL